MNRLNTFDPGARLKIEPQVVELRTLLLHKQGKTAEAAAVVKEFQQSPNADPGLAAALWEQIGQAAAAEEILRKLAKSPDQQNSVRLAIFLGRQGRLRD